MNSENNNENNKYKHDIEIIKDVLLKVEEKPLFGNWVFFTYGIVFLVGALINYLLIIFTEISLTTLFFKFWLPVLIILLMLEPLALIRKMSKESLPIFSKTIIKLYLGVTGLSVSMVFIFIIIANAGYLNMLPACFLCFWAIAYLFYAQVASSSMFIHGYIFIIAGILLFLSGISLEAQIITTALLLGFSSITIGITGYLNDKKTNE